MTGDKYNYESRVHRYERKNLGENADKVLKSNTNDEIEVFSDEEIETRTSELKKMEDDGFVDIITTNRGRGKKSGLSYDFMYGRAEENMHGGLMRYVEAGIFEDKTVEGFTRSDAQNLGNKMNEIEKRNKGKDGFIIKGKTKDFDGRMQAGDGRRYTYKEYLELAEAAGYSLKDEAALRREFESKKPDPVPTKVESDKPLESEAKPVEVSTGLDEGNYTVTFDATTITNADGSSSSHVTGTVTGPDGQTHKVDYTLERGATSDDVNELTEGNIEANLVKETVTDDSGNTKIVENLVVTVDGKPANEAITNQVRQAFENASRKTDGSDTSANPVVSVVPDGVKAVNSGTTVPTSDDTDSVTPGAQGVSDGVNPTNTVAPAATDGNTPITPVTSVVDDDVAESEEEQLSDQELLDAQITALTGIDEPDSVDAGVALRKLDDEAYDQMWKLQTSAKVVKRRGFLGLGRKQKVDRAFTAEEQKQYDKLADTRKLLSKLRAYNSGMSGEQHIENPSTKDEQNYFKVAVKDNEGNVSYRFVKADYRHAFIQQASEVEKTGVIPTDMQFYGATVVEKDGKIQFAIDKDNVLTADQVQTYARYKSKIKD